MISVTRIAVLFFLALIIRIGYAVACYLYLAPEGLMGPDSYSFLQTAQYLADGGSILQVAGEGHAGMDINVMPIAPMIMALTLSPGGIPDPLNYVLVQAVVDAGTCVLIAYLAHHIKEGLFTMAGVLAAVNPTQIVVSGMFYTDTPFLFFVTAGLVLTVVWFKNPSLRLALIMGAVWGLALMTRPFVQYWLFLLPFMLIVFSLILRRPGFIRQLLQMVLMGVLVCAIASPMALRNYDQFNTVKLSAQAGSHLLFWVTPLVREFKDGTPRAVSKARGDMLHKNWNGPAAKNSFQNSEILTHIARQELSDLGLVAIASAWLKGAVMNVLAPAATIATPVSSLPRTGFYDTPGENLEDKVLNYLFNNEGSTYTAILLVSGATMPFWVVMGIAGIFIGLSQKPETSILVLLLVLWFGFTLALNGPVVSPKYRLPLEPAWVVFSALSLTPLWHWISDRFARRQCT